VLTIENLFKEAPAKKPTDQDIKDKKEKIKANKAEETPAANPEQKQEEPAGEEKQAEQKQPAPNKLP